MDNQYAVVGATGRPSPFFEMIRESHEDHIAVAIRNKPSEDMRFLAGQSLDLVNGFTCTEPERVRKICREIINAFAESERAEELLAKPPTLASATGRD